MELRQLVYFEAVARHGGFTRAAVALRIAQPAVSARVAQLEHELGVTLFERTTRRVRLTQAGELMLARVRRITGELDAARAELDQLASVPRGRVRLGAIQSLHPFNLAGALAAFHRRYPDVQLTLRSGPLHQLLTDLDRDVIDLAIGPLRSDLPERFNVAHLFTEELVLLTAPGHRLAARGPLHLRELTDEPFVCLPEDSGLRRILTDAADEAGFSPDVPFESTNLSRIRELVSNGLGVALLARSVAESPGAPVSVHSVRPSPIERPVALLCHRGRPLGPASRACHELLAQWPVLGS